MEDHVSTWSDNLERDLERNETCGDGNLRVLRCRSIWICGSIWRYQRIWRWCHWRIQVGSNSTGSIDASSIHRGWFAILFEVVVVAVHLFSVDFSLFSFLLLPIFSLFGYSCFLLFSSFGFRFFFFVFMVSFPFLSVTFFIAFAASGHCLLCLGIVFCATFFAKIMTLS